MNYQFQAFGQYKESEIASTLKQRDSKDATDLIIREERDVQLHNRKLYENRGGCKSETIMARDYKDPQCISDDVDVVRRLTPLECERLQGFPDRWTDIGEWTDSKGKLHKESSDSARYKALGNSIATPFWQYLARRICAQYERDITMGSLFDGIGGFPYVFERCGAKAVWASEIEEFPIAVTKEHFPEGTEQKWIKE